MNRLKVSRNFSMHEFQCREGQEVKLHEDLIERLQLLRERIGKPILITSGYRTREYNSKVGGARNSYHMRGMAADIQARGMSVQKLAQEAAAAGFLGIGVYENFVHVDVRDYKAYWGKNF